MRITSKMLTNNFLQNLNNNTSRMETYQYQLSTSKRMQRLSDDPVGILRSMEARVKLYRNEQYQKNVTTAKTWLTQAETSLDQLNNLLKTAYENTVQMSTSSYNESDQAATASLIGQLRDHVLTLANSQTSDRYIFGGYNTTSTPFTVQDGKVYYNGLDMSDETLFASEEGQALQFEIGYGIKLDVTMTGTDLLGLGDENIYNTLNDLYEKLQSGSDVSDISVYIEKLQNAQSSCLALMADVGGRVNRLDLMENRYAEEEITYTAIKSEVEDVDQAEAIMQFKMAEAVYQAALSAGARVLQPSLLNYLN